jgi:hypothetical protein
VGGAGPAGNDYITYFPYFLFFPDDAPLPASSSSSPASRTASLHRRTALRPGATEVRTTVASLLWTPRPSSRGGPPDAPRTAPPLVMPAFVPGWDATSCRCRCLHRRVLARWRSPFCRHSVPRCTAVNAPPRRVPARVRVHARGRAGPTPLAPVCTPAHANLGTRPGLWSLCACAVSHRRV